MHVDVGASLLADTKKAKQRRRLDMALAQSIFKGSRIGTHRESVQCCRGAIARETWLRWLPLSIAPARTQAQLTVTLIALRA
jgi:hypothetical protein